MARLLGVMRDKVFSPNMSKNDHDIFMAVTDRLRERGCHVDVLDEGNLTIERMDNDYDLVFTMLRGGAGVRCLQEYQSKHPGRVVNSPEGIHACRKDLITEVMRKLNVPMPRSVVLQLNHTPTLPHDLAFPLWLKRADQCAQCREDVVFIEDHTALLEELCNFKVRGVESALLTEHLVGDLVKFYSVEGTTFFDWDYADPNHSKYGHEQINGEPHKYAFDNHRLKAEADRLAAHLGVPVYGGDCIVDSQGQFRIIDFNDWPSFSRCRYRASIAIADRIMSILNSPPI